MHIRTAMILPAVLSLALCGCAGQASAVSSVSEVTEKTELMEQPRVSYLGPAGTYTEEATAFLFPDASEMMPEATVDEAIAAVKEGRADYAVIPQENTLGGAVTNYADALIHSEGIYVTGEVILPISQTLLGVPGAQLTDIKTVCSHPQGITQSEQWRKENLPDAVTQEMASTAAAAEYVSQQKDPSIAAVGAPGAAELYGLEILAENIQITDANKTRFYVLTTQKPEGSGYTRAVFIASCAADRFDDILTVIHETGLELVTVHDRPEGSALGTYNYIIEVTDEKGITKTQIEKVTEEKEVRYLGSFDMKEKPVKNG